MRRRCGPGCPARVTSPSGRTWLTVAEAADRLGGLDVLVNNAGIYLAHPVMATSYEEWQDVWRATLNVNLIGAANATWCAVRHMTRSNGSDYGGRIVNVGSRGAFRGEPAHPRR